MKTNTSSKLTFILVLSTVLVSCSAQNDRERMGLKGGAKSCQERVFSTELIDGEWQSTEMQDYGHSNNSYDKNGQYMGSEYLSANGEINASLKPIHENGKLIEENFYNQYEELTTQTKHTHLSKKEVSFEAFSPDGAKQIEGMITFKNSRMVKQSILSFTSNASGEELVTVFEYDKKGNMVLTKQSNSEGEIIMSYSFEYTAFDDKNNWTKKLVYDFVNNDGEEPQGIVLREISYY
jgi:hypothetical protein